MLIKLGMVIIPELRNERTLRVFENGFYDESIWIYETGNKMRLGKKTAGGNSWFVLITKYSGVKIKDKQIGGAEEKWVQGFGRETRRKETTFGKSALKAG
jgi:hypothetical protein